MKSFKQLREELSPGFVSQFKSSVNKPRRPYRNVGGRITKYYDPENDGKNDLKKISTPAHEIVFNKKEKGKNKK